MYPIPIVPLQTTVESFMGLLSGLLQWPRVLALPILVLTIWVVWTRTQEDSDSVGSFAVASETGSLSVSVSGAYWVALLVAAVAVLSWPLPLEYPLFGVAHLGLLGVTYWIEKREAM